ncbi:translation initiation factor IF-2-like [Amphibalanus amphitrite]|uniref:translation initiation factor IF-2-like n=1 Tax=Amphibalanus amphitrite TaxID=1232801 RepID=UPI001C91A958|nr:translation initiation factor IF-2-like [Amphibalanus amphitrite]
MKPGDSQLVEAVRKREALWNVRQAAYHQRKHKLRLWAEVAAETGRNVADVKSRWKSIRDYFMKCRQAPPSGSAASSTTDGATQRELSFLNDSVKPKPVTTNLTAPHADPDPLSFVEDPHLENPDIEEEHSGDPWLVFSEVDDEWEQDSAPRAPAGPQRASTPREPSADRPQQASAPRTPPADRAQEASAPRAPTAGRPQQASAPRTPPADRAQEASAPREPTADRPEQGEVQPQRPRRRARRVAADEGTREILQRAIEQVQQAVERLEDDDAIFGHLVGQDIRQVATRKKSLLKIQIMQLIHAAAYEE